MAEKESTQWSEPEFQTLYAPPSYDTISPEKGGVYKFVWDGSQVVGVLWTDLAGGAGLISTGDDTPVVQTVRNYLSDMAAVQLPAVQTYVLIDSKVATSDERNGQLQDAIDAADQVSKTGEIPEEPEEDFDD